MGERDKCIDMPQDRLAAARIESREAICLDIALRAEPELFLDRDFYRQAVAVPAGPPRDVKSLHGLEPREGVLQHPGLDGMAARQAVRGRRTLVEDPGRPACCRLQAAVEGLARVT